MAEDRVDIPTSFWERLVSDKRRLAAVVVGALLCAALLGALGVWAAVRLGDDDKTTLLGGLESMDADVEAESGDGTSASEQGEDRATDAEDADATEDADSSEGGDGDGDDAASGPKIVRAARVAYRIGGAIWVADENGSSAVEVATSAAGDFMLAPDGTVLAWIDAGSHVLHLTTVSDGIDIVVGSAEDIRPSWSADSQYLSYTALMPTRLEVRRVDRGGSDDIVLGAGHAPAISSDGTVIAYVGAGVPGAAGPVVVWELDDDSRTLEDVLATDVVIGGDGIIYATAGTAPESERIMTIGLDGGQGRELAGAAHLGGPVMYADLMLSPAGDALAYAASGDDGFSRTSLCPCESGSTVALTVRRDTYPMTWSADGSEFFFIEGNGFQGEATSLMSVGVDGLGRRVIVEDAGL